MRRILTNSICQNPTDLLKGGSTDLLEDRSSFLRSDSAIVWSSGTLTFPSDIVLDIVNTYNGSESTYTISTSGSPISLSDGESLWVQIDRTLTTQTVTPHKTSVTALPIVSTVNKDVFVIAKRRDVSGTAYLHIPLHKQILNPGDSVILGNVNPPNSGTPAGTIVEFASNTPPSGWLVCDGSAVSRSTYAALFSAIGSTWGQGDQSTTFNLPDLRGVTTRMVDWSSGFGTSNRDPDKTSRTAQSVGSYIVTGDTVNGNSTVTLASGTTLNLAPGMSVTGSNIPANTVVYSITDATHFVLGTQDQSATVNATGTITGTTLTFSVGATANYVGSYQSDDFKQHTHGVTIYADDATNPANPTHARGTDGAGSAGTETSGGASTIITGNETRMKNAYINKIIKY